MIHVNSGRDSRFRWNDRTALESMIDIILKIITPVLAIASFYLYIENRRLRGFEIDHNIELQEIEIDRLEKFYEKKILNFYERSLTLSTSMMTETLKDIIDEQNTEERKVKAKLNYLKRLKKYRWIFSRRSFKK